MQVGEYDDGVRLKLETQKLRLDFPNGTKVGLLHLLYVYNAFIADKSTISMLYVWCLLHSNHATLIKLYMFLIAHQSILN